MPDTTETRDIVERLEGLAPSIPAMRDGAREIRHLRFQVSGQAAEIERLSRELLEAKEALAHYDHFLIDLTEDFIGSFDGAELQDMLVANGLYVIEDFDPAKHHDWSGAAEPGDNFYTPSDVVLKARSVLSPKKGHG